MSDTTKNRAANALTANDVLPYWPLYRLTLERANPVRPPDTPEEVIVRVRTRVAHNSNPHDDTVEQHVTRFALTGDAATDAPLLRAAQRDAHRRLALHLTDAPVGGTP